MKTIKEITTEIDDRIYFLEKGLSVWPIDWEMYNPKKEVLKELNSIKKFIMETKE